MNRRRLLQALAAATFAAVVEVTGIQPKVEAPTVLEVNPEYLTADYEEIFIWNGPAPAWINNHSPARYSYDGDKFVEVPRFTKA